MKKSLFFAIAVTALTTLLAFNWTPSVDTQYKGLVESEVKNEYLRTASSDQLTSNLTEVFAHLYDEILQVDIHQSVEHGYYYTVYGKQQGKKVVKAIKVTEQLASKEQFPNLQQLGITDQSSLAAGTCYWTRQQLCTPSSIPFWICGYIVNGYCMFF